MACWWGTYQVKGRGQTAASTKHLAITFGGSSNKEGRSVSVDSRELSIRRVELNYAALVGNARRARMKDVI